MNQCVQRSSAYGLSDEITIDRGGDSLHDGKAETHEKDRDNTASNTSGQVEFRLYKEMLEISEPAGSNFSEVQIIYIRSTNSISKFEKKRPVYSAKIQEPSTRTSEVMHTPTTSGVDSADPCYSLGRETMIVQDSLSSHVMFASALWMKRGFLLKKWMQIVSRIEDGKLFIGIKSYSLQKARLVTNSYGVDLAGGIFLFTFKIHLSLKLFTFGTKTYEQRETIISSMLRSSTQNHGHSRNSSL